MSKNRWQEKAEDYFKGKCGSFCNALIYIISRAVLVGKQALISCVPVPAPPPPLLVDKRSLIRYTNEILGLIEMVQKRPRPKKPIKKIYSIIKKVLTKNI